MKIRDHLRKRRLAFWVALGVWAFLGFLAISGPRIVQYAWFGAAAALLIGQFWLIRCTRCESHIPSAWGVGLGKPFNPINFCPFCGVSLDESASQAEAASRLGLIQALEPLRTRSAPIWFAGIATLAAFGAAGYMFLSATATASLRFWYCGPSSLEHPEPGCRIATKLLLASYGTAVLGIALAILALWLHVHRLKGSNNSFKPKPLGGSA